MVKKIPILVTTVSRQALDMFTLYTPVVNFNVMEVSNKFVFKILQI